MEKLRSAADTQLDPGAATPVPKEYLRWLYQALGASSVAVYLYGRRGTLVEAVRLGTHIPDLPISNDLRGSDLQVLRLMPETKGKVIVSGLRDTARPVTDAFGIFGFLVIYRTSGVSDSETKDLEELSLYLAEEIIRRHDLIAASRGQRARIKIEEVVHRESRTGTRLAAVIRHLQGGTEASYIGFGVIQQSGLRLLYIRRPHDQGHAKYVTHEPVFQLSTTLQQQCSDRAVARLDLNADRQNVARILGLRPYEAADMRFFMAAAASDGEALAVFILANSQRAPVYGDIQLLELSSFALDQLTNDIERLYAYMNNRMIVNPAFRGRHPDVILDEVFVLMPFSEPWSNQIWQQLVRPICNKQGFVARRADDFYGSVIMEDIWRGICRARIVIADITNRNANVFYELGIAHTIGKSVILITQNLDDLPADLHHYRCIRYENNIGGYAPFEQALANALRELAGIAPKEQGEGR